MRTVKIQIIMDDDGKVATMIERDPGIGNHEMMGILESLKLKEFNKIETVFRKNKFIDDLKDKLDKHVDALEKIESRVKNKIEEELKEEKESEDLEEDK